MKFSGSKNSIIILIVCFILLLFSLLIFYFRDVVSNGIKYDRWFTLDKYEELIEDCDWERDGKEIKLTCNALLHVASYEDNEIGDRCYSFLTISKKDESKKPEIYNICEKDSNVNWDSMSQWLKEKERMTPVEYKLVYQSKNFVNFTYDRIEIRNATNDELFNEFYLNIHLKEIPIASEYLNKDIYDNYVYIEKGTFGIEEMGHIYILDAKLVEKSIEDNNLMYFTFETRINDQNIKIKTHTNGFMLMKQEGVTFLQEYFTKNTSDQIPLDGKYQLRFFYITGKTDNLNQKVEEICKSEIIHITNKSLCDNKEEILKNEFKVTSKDEILKDLKKGNLENIVNIDNGILYILNI